jgi:hypothetical protein
MTGFYTLLDKLKTELKSIPFVNTVTYGDISDIDLSKKTIFPLSHFIVNSFSYNNSVVNMSLSLLCMDIVEESKEDVTDIFVGNTNEQDIFNTQMNVVVRILDVLNRGDLRAEGFELIGNPTVEAFTDRFDNKLAGWACTFDVSVINNVGIC